MKLSNNKYILLISLVTFLMNFKIFVTSFSWNYFFISSSASISSTILLLTLFSFNKIAIKFFSILWILMSMISFYALDQYGIIIDEFIN